MLKKKKKTHKNPENRLSRLTEKLNKNTPYPENARRKDGHCRGQITADV
ncbi:hypothetical protein [Escherichia coli]|nr:hypothetical protein [Escherichia coli]